MKITYFYGDCEFGREIEIDDGDILSQGTPGAGIEYINDVIDEHFRQNIYAYLENEEETKQELKKLFNKNKVKE